MIINSHIVKAFEQESLKKESLSIEKKYAILEGMYTHTRHVDTFDKTAALDGLETDIEIARILHLDVQKTSY